MTLKNKLWNAWLWYLGIGAVISLGMSWLILPAIGFTIHWTLGVAITILTIFGLRELDKN